MHLHSWMGICVWLHKIHIEQKVIHSVTDDLRVSYLEYNADESQMSGAAVFAWICEDNYAERTWIGLKLLFRLSHASDPLCEAHDVQLLSRSVYIYLTTVQLVASYRKELHRFQVSVSRPAVFQDCTLMLVPTGGGSSSYMIKLR